jgi:hypothetical protein
LGHEFQPEGEAIRRAVRWIAEQRELDTEAKLGALIDQAALKYDLTPLETDFLWRMFTAPSKST